ncbi:MAG TPA: hypothetical protein VJA46_09910 [Acidimicrobiia bacterium]|nr:hypothetical protein [Acidimicrobiia bacterium]
MSEPPILITEQVPAEYASVMTSGQWTEGRAFQLDAIDDGVTLADLQAATLNAMACISAAGLWTVGPFPVNAGTDWGFTYEATDADPDDLVGSSCQAAWRDEIAFHKPDLPLAQQHDMLIALSDCIEINGGPLVDRTMTDNDMLFAFNDPRFETYHPEYGHCFDDYAFWMAKVPEDMDEPSDKTPGG